MVTCRPCISRRNPTGVWAVGSHLGLRISDFESKKPSIGVCLTFRAFYRLVTLWPVLSRMQAKPTWTLGPGVYGRGTRRRSLGDFSRRTGDRLLSGMRRAITTAAQSIFALPTVPAGARRDRRIENPEDALALSERVVRAKDISHQLPGVAVQHARRTLRVSRLLQLFAHGAGGKPSERLINRLACQQATTPSCGT